MFNKAAVIGTGLIGGSLAMEIRKLKLAKEVVGVCRHKESLAWAKSIGAIDYGSQNLEIIKNADLLILAMPVNSIISLAPAIARIIGKDCLVTDVGSTKKEIVRTLEKLFPNYVGSHPLAGSEKRGVKNAHKDLFKDSLCILTPTKKTKTAAMRKISLLWKKVGARTVSLKPEVHDKILSFVSHIPHVAAFSLIESVPEPFLKFSSGGLKDTTRIAASDNELWTEIFLTNRKNIIRGIKIYQKNLTAIKSAILEKNRKKLSLILKRAKDKRNRLP
jgi:prephenate dehydrogenase